MGGDVTGNVLWVDDRCRSRWQLRGLGYRLLYILTDVMVSIIIYTDRYDGIDLYMLTDVMVSINIVVEM